MPEFAKYIVFLHPQFTIFMSFSNNNYSGQPATSVTTNLIIINVLMLAADFVLERRGISLSDYLGLHYFDASHFHNWQYVTYMFMHGSFYHLFTNMFSLYMFGRLLEEVWGSSRFLIYYLVCGVGAAIIQQAAWRLGIINTLLSQIRLEDAGYTYGQLLQEGSSLLDRLVTIGASGSVFGVLLAFGMMFPNARIFLLFPPMPLKAKWLVVGYGLFELFCGVSSTGDGIAHFAHLGGMLFGFILIMMWRHDRRTEF